MLHVMRLVFLLSIGIVCQVSATSLAQSVKLKERTQTLESIFKQVETQTGKFTLYSNNELNMNRVVKLDRESFTLEELYRMILKGTNLEFVITPEYVVVRPARAGARDSVREMITVTGVVQDEKGEPMPGVTVVRCENTAMAAKRVAESDRTDVAALSSRACVGLYGLESLASSVQDQGNNYTRFICIAKDLEIYPGADRTSLMMVLPHKPGSLYKVLSRFYALGINLNKLESRPLPERDFEFMFYFDLETSVYSPQFRQLMGELPGLCEEFSYLGSYQEVV